MKYLKIYEKFFENEENSIIGAKVGDTIVYDDNIITSLKRGNKYIIEKIYDYHTEEESPKIKDLDDLLVITNLKGERMNFQIRAHYFTTEISMDAKKYNL